MVKREKIAPSFQVPDDIEIDILSRLSVKSLLRFKCVKKSWRYFIEDPVFIAMHLDYYGVEVYSWNRNSWRSTKIVNPRSVLTTSFQGKGYFNGAFHWGGRNLKSSKRMIMSFQFDEEVFRELNLPNHPDFQEENYFLNALIIEYQNFFSLIIKQKVNMHVYDLWVMKEYGVSDSWIKQLTIEVPVLEVRLMFRPVMSFENNGELLVLSDWYGRIVWYNTKTKQIERSKEVLRGRSIRYKESLVSLSRKKVV
ncbi:hypothetical protein ES332_D06G225800v1 [Gossypium tomentosum]|uniref:F-box domain-containing protein n=1 Tax=Gossypium tomentosum TaxID=34277 RepID=A0A5D2KLE4_GOSTO|nr:hypothetical protein ES332_D06G225800v1 [Gossypium tomentosum]